MSNLTSQPTQSVNLSLPVGGILVINLSATSIASTGAGALFTDCSATMDPLLSFDQAAFDALMGGSTFPLADHYAFDVSANLIPLVPGLGDGARVLLVLAIAALGFGAAAATLRARAT